MGLPIEVAKKFGHDPRTTREKADDVLSQASDLVSWGEDSREKETIAFPDIPLKANGVPKRRLTNEEEAALTYRFHRYGDLRARDILMLSQMGLLYIIANRYRVKLGNKFDDAVQEAYCKGLTRAAELFDPDKGMRFSTYASGWIKADIGRFANKEKDAATAGVEGLRGVRHSLIPLESPVGGGEGLTVVDTCMDTSKFSADQIAIRNETSRVVRSCVERAAAKMNDSRIASIVQDRLLSDEPQELRVLGERHSVSRERIRQIEAKLVLNIKIEFEAQAKPIW